MNKTLFTVTPSLIGTDFVELVEYTGEIDEADLRRDDIFHLNNFEAGAFDLLQRV